MIIEEGTILPKPNEPCLCGSGRKFKKCHGRPCVGCGRLVRWWRLVKRRGLYAELPTPGTDGKRNFSVHCKIPACAPPWYSIDYLWAERRKLDIPLDIREKRTVAEP